LAAAARVVGAFAEAHPKAFPPIVLNLTDGRPSDGDPRANALLVRGVATTDGTAQLFNLLIAGGLTLPTYFPADESVLPDVYAKVLFRMSSALPPPLWSVARAEGFDVAPGARGVVVNADPV